VYLQGHSRIHLPQEACWKLVSNTIKISIDIKTLFFSHLATSVLEIKMLPMNITGKERN
jgi:hypothetical protein